MRKKNGQNNITIGNMQINSNGCVGIGTTNPSANLRVRSPMATLYYVDTTKCLIEEKRDMDRVEDYNTIYFNSSTREELIIETRVYHQLHSTDFSSAGGTVVLMCQKPNAEIHYCSAYLTCVEQQGCDFLQRDHFQRMTFLINRSSPDKGIIDVDYIKSCRILTKCDSNKEVEEIYKRILNNFFELNYSPILLAHPNQLVRDIARNLEKLKIRETNEVNRSIKKEG